MGVVDIGGGGRHWWVVLGVVPASSMQAVVVGWWWVVLGVVSASSTQLVLVDVDGRLSSGGGLTLSMQVVVVNGHPWGSGGEGLRGQHKWWSTLVGRP